MLFLHEIHRVMGEHAFQFEDAWRDVYMPSVAQDDDARLLFYWTTTHGSGEAYKVITVTGLKDGAAWDRLVERERYGDLAEWTTDMDAIRYKIIGSLLVELAPGVGDAIDLSAVPFDGARHPTSLFRYDAIEVGSQVGQLVDRARSHEHDPDASTVRFRQAFVPLRGVYESSEAFATYEVVDLDRLAVDLGEIALDTDWGGTLTTEEPLASMRRRSRMLRTSSWSPLY